MKEKYLHYLWQYKLMPLHSMTLTDGRQFKLIHQGDYNANESGPDFLNAKIEIDGITWAGNIEIHVKSKDWFVHNHHFDSAYDSVILHVVYQHNGEVKVRDSILPVLELKEWVDHAHYRKFESLLKAKRTSFVVHRCKHFHLFTLLKCKNERCLNALPEKHLQFFITRIPKIQKMCCTI